jgi:hypothetical protein
LYISSDLIWAFSEVSWGEMKGFSSGWVDDIENEILEGIDFGMNWLEERSE